MPLLSHHWDYKGMGNAGWVRADGYWLDGDLYIDCYNKLVEMYENQPPAPTGISDNLKIESANYTTSLDKTNPYSFLLDTTNRKFRLPFLNKSEKLVIYKTSEIIPNGASASNVYTTYYSDGTVKVEGIYDSTGLTSGTINWTAPLKTDYRVNIQDTKLTNSDTDTEGWQYFAGPAVYSATSLRISHYKASDRKIEFTIEGTLETYIVPSFRFMYFKLGNTFTNEGEMNASEISDKIDRVWDSWQDADYVVDSYTNETEWYRLYKSGWLEQGGKNKSGSSVTVSLHLPFIDTNYNLQLSFYGNSNGYPPCIKEKTTTSFTIYSGGAATKTGDWYACGQSN